MGSFRRPRPRFMSSPVLTDLARFHASSPALQLSNTSVWNSVQTAVIKVFQGGGLQTNELYALNESIRWLLKTELGSFITEYLQNQLLNKGLVYILERIQLYDGEDQLIILSEMWGRFFTEILPTIQAIFYPVQGQELSVRQMALLSFRDLVLLKLSLEELLPKAPLSLPPAIRQMLLILQGIHEPSGPSEEYHLLERLVGMVISPYLGNYIHREHAQSRSARVGQPEIMITQYATDPLGPLVEQEKSIGVRRHTVANAHTDIQLLSPAARMHPGKGEDGAGGTAGRTFSSEPDILESPSIAAGLSRRQSSVEMCCVPPS